MATSTFRSIVTVSAGWCSANVGPLGRSMWIRFEALPARCCAKGYPESPAFSSRCQSSTTPPQQKLTKQASNGSTADTWQQGSIRCGGHNHVLFAANQCSSIAPRTAGGCDASPQAVEANGTSALNPVVPSTC